MLDLEKGNYQIYLYFDKVHQKDMLVFNFYEDVSILDNIQGFLKGKDLYFQEKVICEDGNDKLGDLIKPSHVYRDLPKQALKYIKNANGNIRAHLVATDIDEVVAYRYLYLHNS